ncbi:hypothetical protein C1H46_031412 [Malus baccata]|uniref:Uncharacterized protein n=1 Tax=Malus baccata TaxID=106549 RepID=A0A540L967_MALBA|nr:hypothetical protein C1H46_031412 [Malus baccata]
MNLSGSLSQNCELQHPPRFDVISSLLLCWTTSPPPGSSLIPFPPLGSVSSAPSPGSEKKRAADYGGSVISSRMSVVPTSPLKSRFWFLSFTLAGGNM